MRVFQRQFSGRLLRSAAFLAVAGLSTGCSSSVMRFQDGIFTGSIRKDQAPVASNMQMPAVGQQANAKPQWKGSAAHQDIEPVSAAPKGVSRNALAAPSGTNSARKAATPLIAAEANESAPAPVTEQVASLEPKKAKAAAETLKTAAADQEAAAKPARKEGWSKAGGTHVELGEGETIYNLSRRFGVPANAIMEANGISDASSVKSGTKLLIPTYVYSRTAPVSAPDNDANTASASSTKGARIAAPEKKLPLPGEAPAKQEAILPVAASSKKGEGAEKAKQTADAAPKADKKPAVAGDTYVVQEGDSLYGISKKTGVSVAELKKTNGMKEGLLKIGQTLALKPGVQVAAVAKASKTDAVDPVVTGDPKPAAEAKNTKLPEYTPPKADDKVIEQAEQEVATAAPSGTGVSKMRWPAKGKVIAGYGARSGAGKNAGLDIALPKGTPVKAAENGVVIYAGDGLKEFGKTVLVRHENGLVSVYGHVDEINVQRGATIKRGQEIAKSGMTGNADMPKLHFEVRKDSKPVDPSTYLE